MGGKDGYEKEKRKRKRWRVFRKENECRNQSKDWVRPAALKWHVAGRVCKGRGITLVPWCIDVLGLLVEGC